MKHDYPFTALCVACGAIFLALFSAITGLKIVTAILLIVFVVSFAIYLFLIFICCIKKESK